MSQYISGRKKIDRAADKVCFRFKGLESAIDICTVECY